MVDGPQLGTEIYWLEIYRKWDRDRLLQEIVSCHKFQLSILAKVANKQLGLNAATSLCLVSHQREALIVEVLEEKSKNGTA